jgi:hypothetical protein
VVYGILILKSVYLKRMHLVLMSTTATRMQTMARSYQEILQGQGGTPWVPLGNFMLDFFRNFPAPEQRAALLAEPLEGGVGAAGSVDAHKWAVFCAASVEYLAHEYGLECPAWVNDPAYQPLPEPWYFSPMSYVKEHVRLMEEQETPQQFARRNIYCGEVYVDKYTKAQKYRQLRRTA